MANNDHIDPMIIFGPGSCIHCGGQLMVADMETTFMTLAPSGSPVTEETMICCEAVCSSCGKRIPMMRNGMNYVPDNPYTQFIKEYMDYVKTEQFKASMEELKPTADNPFCINIERQK